LVLQVAKLLSVQNVPNSDKLLKVQVEIAGGEQKQARVPPSSFLRPVCQSDICPPCFEHPSCGCVSGTPENQIIAGLQKFVTHSELLALGFVAIILNLKPARLAGEASEAMILAGVQEDAAAEHGERVYPLLPPGATLPVLGLIGLGNFPSFDRRALPLMCLFLASWCNLAADAKLEADD
jgi:tRNA-binding EMAP/Myf-like protein